MEKAIKMSVKFDNCPICGGKVNAYPVSFNSDTYVAMCFRGHKITDLTDKVCRVVSDQESAVAREWNKYVREYVRKKEKE